MTLRDYFAAAVVDSIIRRSTADIGFVGAETFARTAYELADAMLKAREVQQ
jgi:hypothetical protein